MSESALMGEETGKIHPAASQQTTDQLSSEDPPKMRSSERKPETEAKAEDSDQQNTGKALSASCDSTLR